MPWLMALDLPQPVGLPPDVTLNHDGELLSRKPVNERIRYTLISNPQYVLEPQLDARARTRLTRLPKGRDPRTIALAQGWTDHGRRDADIVAASMNMSRTEKLVDHFRPPTPGRARIDKFLLERKSTVEGKRA